MPANDTKKSRAWPAPTLSLPYPLAVKRKQNATLNWNLNNESISK